MDTSWHSGGALTPLEEEMRTKAAAGELTDRGTGPFNLAQMDAWGEDRAVRAAVLRRLLITDEWPVDAKGVRLRGVRISGYLDLEAATLRCPLSLDSCYLDTAEAVCLEQANASLVSLIRCHLAGLSGTMVTARRIDLHGSRFTGPVNLDSANIASQLICDDAQLSGKTENGDALSAYGIKVGGDVSLRKVATAGAIRLTTAEIAGSLICSGAQLTGNAEDSDALIAYEIKVGGDVFLNDGFTGTAVTLAAAEIGGLLLCSGARLTGRNEEGDSLSAHVIKVGGSVHLREVVTASAVSLPRADITGHFDCTGAQLKGRNEDGEALSAYGIKSAPMRSLRVWSRPAR